MKKYFFNKTLVWSLIITFVFAAIIGAVTGTLIPISHLMNLNIDVSIIREIYIPVSIAVCILSGRIFAKRLKSNGNFEGDFSKYQYLYYPLIVIGGYLISKIGVFIRGFIEEYAFGAVNENDFNSVITVWLLSNAIGCIFDIVVLIVGSKLVSALLCAVTEGEEAEKNYFSKAFLPLAMSLTIALVLNFIFAVHFNHGAYSLVDDIVNAIYFAGLLALLKYKFDDEKIKNFTCNILPFVYILISAVFTAIRLMQII